jgi:signal transduction histidine kinase/CheY-like chemotaxis protein
MNRARPLPLLVRFGSLRTRLVLLVALLLCAVAIPLLLSVPAHMETLSRQWTESRSMGIAKLVAAATAPALEFDDAVAATAMLENLSSTRGAAWAALVRPDGSTLARWRDPPAIGRGPVAEEGIEYGAEVIVVRLHVAGRSGRVGSLAIAFDLAELQARRAETLRWLAMASAVLLVMGVTGAYLIGTIVARPLRRMTAVAERIAEGDLCASHDLQTARRDEAGALARAFQFMLARLYEQRAALTRTNGELADKLAQLKRTQEELVAADRRISVGRLAAGVAHEINNPLAYVGANLRFVAEWLAEAFGRPDATVAAGCDPQVQEVRLALAEATQGTERIRQIVKGLKTFSRSDDDRRETLQLSVPLEAAIAMAKHEVQQRARLRRNYGDTPAVLASEVRLSQVFLNLLINASHAIPEGELDRQSVTITTRTDGSGFAVVEVTDTGSGMPADVLAKLFQPFFTTKPAGVGTGLGLAISQDIIRAHGGRIEVESVVGRGSTFRVLLPPATSVVKRAEAAPAPRPRSSATLLVIDDEPLVGAALARALGSEFEVVTLSSASQALDLLATGAFQHVLCDVMMPDMNGAAFHAELERRAPGLASRVIFMTGGAFTPATESFLSSWRGSLLEKPIDLDQLRRVIHAMPG